MALEDLQVEGIVFQEARGVTRVRLFNTQITLGFIDEDNKTAYMPGNDYHMRLANKAGLDSQSQSKMGDAYDQLFANLTRAGYTIRLICDDTD